jgi:hypothetical protein
LSYKAQRKAIRPVGNCLVGCVDLIGTHARQDAFLEIISHVELLSSEWDDPVSKKFPLIWKYNHLIKILRKRSTHYRIQMLIDIPSFLWFPQKIDFDGPIFHGYLLTAGDIQRLPGIEVAS